MRIIDWNLSWLKENNTKIDYLLKQTSKHSFVVILQEVTQSSYEALCEEFAKIANIEYSLNYRVPGKYDTSSRKLGIAILTSKDIKISKAQVLERTIMPDRTLMVDAIYNGQSLRIMGLHSITGCQHGKAKEQVSQVQIHSLFTLNTPVLFIFIAPNSGFEKYYSD